jgi:hypothetical protein
MAVILMGLRLQAEFRFPSGQADVVGNIFPILVFELLERADEAVFDGFFPDDGAGEVRRIVAGNF